MISVDSKGPAKIGLWAVIITVLINAVFDVYFDGFISVKRLILNSVFVGFALALVIRLRYRKVSLEKKRKRKP